MPRIKAPTVKEHRADQMSSLLRQARKIVLAEGVSGLSFDILAKKTKISRPAVYEYFKSKPDLIMALIESEFPPWERELLVLLNEENDPLQAIENFVVSQLQWINAGKHELAFILMSSNLDDNTIARVHSLHEELIKVLSSRCKELGVSLPEECIAMISGVLSSSAQLMRKAKNPKQVINATRAFLVAGIKALTFK